MSNNSKLRDFKLKRRFLVIAIVILLFVFVVEISLSVEVKNFIRVTEDKVFLSDCLKGLSFNEEQTAKEIFMIYIPTLGEEKIIKQNYLKNKLRQLKVEDIDKIIIPDEIVVYREYQNFNTNNIYYEVINRLNRIINNTEFEYNINFENEIKKIPIGKVTLDGDYNIFSNLNYGKYRLNYSINVNKKTYEKIIIDVEVGKKIYEYRLSVDVSKGDKFTNDLLIKKEKIVFKENHRMQELNFDIIDKMVFSRNIRKGSLISNKDFEREIIIKKNDIVSGYIENSGIKIKFNCKALENGYENEKIKLVNLSSNKIIVGIVELDGKIKVNSME
ncbi:MAG: flagellar basal body P-ring formation protein FlgA [Fusobacteria bacterium]|nr:flagellar basal body P-ring formation protein FlgA [Fusobacteriota bacterium]